VKPVTAIVLAGGEGEPLSILSAVRAKPAVPFAGKYRIIDFTLSNCINSEIDNVLVLTQYNPRSLNDHIGAGRPWDLDRNEGGIRLLQPYIARGRPSEWYRGTSDAVLVNLEMIRQQAGDLVLILAGDHIYKMDYQPFIAAHRRNRADVTVAVQQVPLGDAHRFGILALDGDSKVVEWQEKPKQPKSDLASLGIYVFSKRALLAWLDESRTDFGRDVIPAMLAGDARVFAYKFDGYWQDVGTVESYWQAHMDLLEDPPSLDLYDKDWLIHTRSEERAPARVGPTANVHRSLISHGCQIWGTVERSVLSPGVRVDPGAVVRDSIIMFDTVIRAGAVVDRAIIDKEVSVGPNAIVGMGGDYETPNRQEPGPSTRASPSSASARSFPRACASASTARSTSRSVQLTLVAAETSPAAARSRSGAPLRPGHAPARAPKGSRSRNACPRPAAESPRRSG